MAFIFSLVALDLETGCASGRAGRGVVGMDGRIRFVSLYYYYLEDPLLLAFLCFAFALVFFCFVCFFFFCLGAGVGGSICLVC